MYHILAPAGLGFSVLILMDLIRNLPAEVGGFHVAALAAFGASIPLLAGVSVLFAIDEKALDRPRSGRIIGALLAIATLAFGAALSFYALLLPLAATIGYVGGLGVLLVLFFLLNRARKR